MTKPELVIFDCDGVLVDSEPISNQVLVDNLAGYGLTLTLAESMDLFVGGTMAGVKVQAEKLGADLPDDWVAQVYAETYTRLSEGVAPVAGVVAVLDRLDEQGIPYCVGSNGSMEKMSITMGQNGLMERFQGAIFSAHVLKVAKPEPELFLNAAAAFGVPPANCVVIEDSVNGVLAAKRARMRCFGYAAHDDGARLAREDAFVFNDMAKLPDLLGLDG